MSQGFVTQKSYLFNSIGKTVFTLIVAIKLFSRLAQGNTLLTQSPSEVLGMQQVSWDVGLLLQTMIPS